MGNSEDDRMGRLSDHRSAAGDGAGRVRTHGRGLRAQSPLTRRQRRWMRAGLLPVAMLLGVFGCATLLQSSEQRVVLSTDPSGAEVAVNGVPSGRTPVEVVLKPTGTYTVLFEKAGCAPFSHALGHEGAWGTFGTMQYPIRQLKPAHVRLNCWQ